MARAFNRKNGAEIKGTLERIPGVALIASFRRDKDGSLEYEHAGETDVFWDGQETLTDAEGLTRFIDYEGEECVESDIYLAGERREFVSGGEPQGDLERKLYVITEPARGTSVSITGFRELCSFIKQHHPAVWAEIVKDTGSDDPEQLDPVGVVECFASMGDDDVQAFDVTRRLP